MKDEKNNVPDQMDALTIYGIICSKNVRANSLIVETKGMEVANEVRKMNDNAPEYGEQAFIDIATEIQNIANEIMDISTEKIK